MGILELPFLIDFGRRCLYCNNSGNVFLSHQVYYKDIGIITLTFIISINGLKPREHVQTCMIIKVKLKRTKISHMITNNHFNTPELIMWGTMNKMRNLSCPCLTRKKKEMTGIPKRFY